MNVLKEWIFKPILFVVLLPFFVLLCTLGFMQCWQCHKTLHIFKSKKYHLITLGSERVCKDCYELLTTKKRL